jgi:ribonuclease HII
MTELVIGADEVGYGSLAGPLVVCGVKAPEGWNLEGLNDSKKLSEKKRLIMGDKLNNLVEFNEISFHIAERSNVTIDKIGVALALKTAYAEVFHTLGEQKPILIIVDGNLKFDNLGLDVYTIRTDIKADAKIPTVMAASIIAKNYRDGLMHSLDELHPEYGWIKNVGYGSSAHIAAMRKYGLSPLHRRSYKVKSIIDLYE